MISLLLMLMLADAPKPPTLTDAQKLKFFKARSEFVVAQQATKDASAAEQLKLKLMQDAIKEITTACGEKAEPFINPDGDLTCSVKAAPASKPVTPK